MNRIGLGIGLLAAVASPAGAASPDPKDLAVPYREVEKARVLVRALGAEAFRDRERAERELAGMGRLAKSVLAEAAGADPSPEVRTRAGRLLPRAEAADLQARIDTFLADADAKYTHDLPGLELFRTHAGAGPGVRELFAEAVKGRANLDLLAALGGAPAEAGKAVADRRVAMFLAQNPQAFGNRLPGSPARSLAPTLPDIAALMAAEVAVPAADIPRGPLPFLSAASFLNTPVAVQAATRPDTTPHGPAFRALLVKWLDTRTAPADLDQIAWLAQSLQQVPETLGLLKRVVTTPGVQGWSKGQALGFVVQRQGKDARPFLRSLLEDETVVATVWLGNNPQGGPVQAPCQLRDLALSVLLLQDKQDLKEYGFAVQPNAAANLANIQNGGIAFAFATPEKRAAGWKKWADREAALKARDAGPPAELAPPPRPAGRK